MGAATRRILAGDLPITVTHDDDGTVTVALGTGPHWTMTADEAGDFAQALLPVKDPKKMLAEARNVDEFIDALRAGACDRPANGNPEHTCGDDFVGPDGEPATYMCAGHIGMLL
jgi:hypothetical protein